MGIFKAMADAMKKHPKGKPHTEGGAEVCDPVPMAPPVGYRAQPSMFDIVRQMVRDERVRLALESEGLETPEEADDFDVGDDPEPGSVYEHDFDHVADPRELQRLRDAIDLRERELRGELRRETPSPGDPGGTVGPAGGPASASGEGKPAGPADGN